MELIHYIYTESFKHKASYISSGNLWWAFGGPVGALFGGLLGAFGGPFGGLLGALGPKSQTNRIPDPPRRAPGGLRKGCGSKTNSRDGTQERKKVVRIASYTVLADLKAIL